ncbi:hypothetical protein ACFQMM_21810 [Saliphagus sp. GCM10025308]
MTKHDTEDAAYMDLTPDSWHQHDGSYAIDCPECGSLASLSNVIEHNRCNGFLARHSEGESEGTDCTAKLWFELGYSEEPPSSDESATESTATTTAEDDDVEDKHDSPAGTDGTVDESQRG